MKVNILKSVIAAFIFLSIVIIVYCLTLEANGCVVCAEQANQVSQNEIVDIKEPINDKLMANEEREKRDEEVLPDNFLLVIGFHTLLIVGALFLVYIGYKYKP